MGSSPCLGGRAHRGRPMATGEAGASRTTHPHGLEGTGRRRDGLFLEAPRPRGNAASAAGEETDRPPLRRTASLPGQPQLRTARGSAESDKGKRSPTGRLRRAQGHCVMPLSGAGHFDWLPPWASVPDGQPRPVSIRQKLSRVEPRSKPRPAKHFRRIPRQFWW